MAKSGPRKIARYGELFKVCARRAPGACCISRGSAGRGSCAFAQRGAGCGRPAVGSTAPPRGATTGRVFLRMACA